MRMAAECTRIRRTGSRRKPTSRELFIQGVFSSIPITERQQERTCEVWAIHIQTGQILGWVKFEDGVQEIFAVRVVPGIRWPDLVNHDTKLLDGSFILSDSDLQRVPEAYRTST